MPNSPSLESGSEPKGSTDHTAGQQAEACIHEIEALSKAINLSIEEEDVFKLNQLLLNRGNAIEAIKKLPLDDISQDIKTSLGIKVEALMQQEPRIQAALKRLSKTIQNRLTKVQEGKQAIGQYKVISPERTWQDNQA